MDSTVLKKSEFCERLKQARMSVKMSQAELSKKIDRPQGRISSYETGKTTPDAETLAAICKVTGVDANWLLFGNKSASRDGTITAEQWLQYLVDLLLDSPMGIYTEKESEGDSPLLVPYELIDFGTTELTHESDCGAAIWLHGPDMHKLFNMITQIKSLNEGFTPEIVTAVKHNICEKYGNYFKTGTTQLLDPVIDENDDIVF